jgi:hypothetical protein
MFSLVRVYPTLHHHLIIMSSTDAQSPQPVFNPPERRDYDGSGLGMTLGDWATTTMTEGIGVDTTIYVTGIIDPGMAKSGREVVTNGRG